MAESKFKTGLVALGGKCLTILAKFTKLFKVGKVGLAAATLAGYSAMYTWKLAILIMVAIGWHESGHVWAMKKMKIPTRGFYFLPFLGGAAIQEEQHKTYGQNVYVAIMGPIWGACLAWLCGILYFTTGIPLLAAAAGWMATLNIFNLLPVTPLDGGQIVRSICFSIHEKLGMIFMGISAIVATIILFKFKVGLFALILIIGLIELVGEYYQRKKIALYKEDKLSKHQLDFDSFDKDGKVKSFPVEMTKKQMALSICSFIFLVTNLIVLVKLMAHVPGAELAANFLE